MTHHSPAPPPRRPPWALLAIAAGLVAVGAVVAFAHAAAPVVVATHPTLDGAIPGPPTGTVLPLDTLGASSALPSSSGVSQSPTAATRTVRVTSWRLRDVPVAGPTRTVTATQTAWATATVVQTVTTTQTVTAMATVTATVTAAPTGVGP